jgi:hypothetical protein
MPKSAILLDYNGLVDFPGIEKLLKKLKNSREFAALDKTTARRTYALTVECLENINKHSAVSSLPDKNNQPHISIRREDDKIIITAGNLVKKEATGKLADKLKEISKLDLASLKTLHEIRISQDFKKNENGAGLGLISMAIKSGNRIVYNFRPSDDGFSYFEIQILLNKYIMRKLIIDQTSCSPKVILDPENDIYQISGESRPPDVREFYDQILSWLDEFGNYLSKSNGLKDHVFSFNFEYFNSSSGKMILDICKVLGSLRARGHNVVVNWHFDKDDVDMLEVGKEISKIVKFPFEYIESKSN